MSQDPSKLDYSGTLDRICQGQICRRSSLGHKKAAGLWISLYLACFEFWWKTLLLLLSLKWSLFFRCLFCIPAALSPAKTHRRSQLRCRLPRGTELNQWFFKSLFNSKIPCSFLQEVANFKTNGCKISLNIFISCTLSYDCKFTCWLLKTHYFNVYLQFLIPRYYPTSLINKYPIASIPRKKIS